MRVVQTYTRMQVTYLLDRLPALAGISGRLATVFEDNTYLAGLWKVYLPILLCWKRE